MRPDRLTKRIFLWDYQLNNNNWSSHIETILNTSHSIVDFNLKRVCEIDNVRKVLTEQFITEWKQNMLKKPKLLSKHLGAKCCRMLSYFLRALPYGAVHRNYGRKKTVSQIKDNVLMPLERDCTCSV